MFFLQACRILAIIALIFGGLKLAIGLSVATEAFMPYEDGLNILKRYFMKTNSSGEVIDRAQYTILFALVLGALTEMGLAMVRMERRNRGEEGA